MEVVSSVTRNSAALGFTRSASVKVLEESMDANLGFWLKITKKLDAVIRIDRNVFSAAEQHCRRADFTVLSGIWESSCSSRMEAEVRTLKSDQFRMLICSSLG